MAINRISGNILQDNLQRGDNLSIQGNLAYFDVGNSRIGVLTDSPSDTLEVDGNVVVGNIQLQVAGNVVLGNIYINGLAYPIQNADAATKKYVDDQTFIVANRLGNIDFIDTTMTPAYSPANITLAPTGNSEVIIDTNSGLVLPVGTTAERPGSPITGSLRFNTDETRVEVYDGTEWDSVVAGVTGQIITPDGLANTYALDRNSTSAATMVAINGVVQLPTVAYTVTAIVITFAEIPLTTDIIDIRFL